ncbi:MAG: hypothetical protein R2879_14460 [Saprospiraceae bacterium]
MKTLFTLFIVSILFLGEVNSQINPCQGDNDVFPGCAICDEKREYCGVSAESTINGLCN